MKRNWVWPLVRLWFSPLQLTARRRVGRATVVPILTDEGLRALARERWVRA